MQGLKYHHRQSNYGQPTRNYSYWLFYTRDKLLNYYFNGKIFATVQAQNLYKSKLNHYIKCLLSRKLCLSTKSKIASSLPDLSSKPSLCVVKKTMRRNKKLHPLITLRTQRNSTRHHNASNL